MKFYAKSERTKEGYSSIGLMSVLQHCVDVGLTTQATLLHFNKNIKKYLARKLRTTEAEVVALFSFLAAIHDVGKVHLYFQANFDNAIEDMLELGLITPRTVERIKSSKFTENNPYQVRHEVVSRKVFVDYLREQGIDIGSNSLLKGLSYAISSHHEKDSEYYERVTNTTPQSDKLFIEEQDNLLRELHKLFPCDLHKVLTYSTKHTDSVCSLFLAILFVSDWISSSYLDNSVGGFDICHREGRLHDFIKYRERQIIKVFDEQLGFINREIIDLSDYSKIFGTDNYTLRPLQRKIKELSENNKFKFLIVEAPMGEGKTETALYASSQMKGNKKGIFFGLPTGVTSTMMCDRLKEIFKRQNINSLNILHSTAFFEEKLYKNDTNDYLHFLSSSRTGIFVDNVVGTVDQAMLSVLKKPFSLLRILGLIGKVLIIDEVHAYDSYMQSIIFNLLSWTAEYEIPVILLSATLPEVLKKQLIFSYHGRNARLRDKSYPLITGIDAKNKVFEAPINSTFMNKNFDWNLIRLTDTRQELLDKVIEKVNEGKNIGIVCNTVGESQAVYTLISSIVNNYDIVLLHSNFTIEDRQEKEEYIKKCLGKKDRKQNLIVVGTQVLEQSLDIDFDVMFSYLAPIDLLLQRIGRCHRFEIKGRSNTPEVYVLLPKNKYEYKDTGYDLIYDAYILKKTEEFLLNNKTCSLPIDFRKIIESVYKTVKIQEINDTDDKQKYSEYSKKVIVTSLQGKQAVILPPQGEEFHRAIVHIPNDSDNLEIEEYGTRLCISQRKYIFLTNDELKEIGLTVEDLEEVKNIDLAKDLLNRSVSINFYKEAVNFKDDDISSDIGLHSVDCGGILKGCRVIFVNKGVDGVKRKKVVLKTVAGNFRDAEYLYNKELGFICNKL